MTNDTIDNESQSSPPPGSKAGGPRRTARTRTRGAAQTANQDLRHELEMLRAEVAQVRAAREAPEKTSKETRGEAEPESVGKESSAAESADLSTQLQALIDAFGEELKDTKPTTLLVIFALGVLVGRLLCK